MRERRRELARRALEGYPDGPAAALVAHTALAGLDDIDDLAGAVLVEGVSDRIAVEAVARRLGRDLAPDGIRVVPTGGAHGTARMLRALASRHPEARLAGLFDVGESEVVRRALSGLGLIGAASPPADAGFFACVDDLEDELLRAAGPDAVEQCLTEQGDLPSFRTLQQQPGWRGRDIHAQLRRWLSSGARRKLRYARILVDATAIERMPRPLVDALDRARRDQA
ncbi:TOPRIM nucleotidyl transferase/hydrolase domain-containing protein [Microbacterium sulfonylureivorans]|uniref:TOPRIM nucleotidyl transferase/hydrolase domain-containing protein n=1 Tax=Microbacterium sulfonylureivorans TaxID=2486854 RepID=UPI001F0C4D3A|nr:TOPRIM nucleotidyl transferase/hydrolase domain-containing protein [Microbacterium sulfonylureivorans]